MVSALTRVFGIHNLALAEDVVQDALCRALTVWKLRGVPDNPSAWLMATAKNRALDVLRRERTARTFAPELARMLDSEWTLAPAALSLFDASPIEDDQLRMMFSCCQPRVPEEAQVALILHILCGFSVAEVASAFLATDAAIEKRIARAKKALASSQRLFDLADADFAERLTSVQRALYLLFNEGYHGAHAESAVRVELCHDAMRLVGLLCNHAADRDAGHVCAVGADVLACSALAGAGRRVRRAARAVRSGPVAVGRRLGARGTAAARSVRVRRRAQRVSRGSGDRRGAHHGPRRRGHELADHHLAVRHADDDSTLAGDRAEPRDRDRAARRVR